MRASDAASLNKWFGPKTEFKKPHARWAEYLKHARAGWRLVLVAEIGKQAVAYGTLNFKSPYPPFKKGRVPEIQDLNVGRPYRRQGIATQLIAALEKQVCASGQRTIGIGVGMEPGYGQAQRLYVKMGYIPDGRGVTYNHRPVVYGQRYPADDDLVLYFTKSL